MFVRLFRPTLAAVLACLLVFLIFLVNAAVPQAARWGMYLLPVVLVFLLLLAAAWLLAMHRQTQAQLARHELELEQQVAARTAALAASEERYRALFDQAGDGIFSVDAGGRYVEVNDRYCRMLGRTRAEIVGAHLGDMTVDITPEFFAAVSEQLAQQGTATFERRLRHKDGTFPAVEVTVAPLSGGHRMAIVRDITARKQLEDALRQSEQKWRSVFEFLPIGLSVVDGKHQVTDTNPALAQILHVSPEGLLLGDYAHRRFVRPDLTPMPPEEFPSLRALREGQTVQDVMIGVECEDGELIWVSVSATPQSIDGLALTVTLDVTERKRLGDQLRDSEERFRLIVENSPDVIALFDAAGGMFYVSPAFEPTHGVAAERALAADPLLLAAIVTPPGEGPRADELARFRAHPHFADRRMAAEAVAFCLQNLGMKHHVEIASPLPSGEIRYFDAVYQAYERAGGDRQVVAITRDITARHQAEARLHDANQRLQLATAAAGIGIWTMNLADNSLEWDERMCELHAVTPEERRAGISYDFWRARVHPDDLAQVDPGRGDPTRLARQWSGAYRVVLSGGAVRHIQANALVEYDAGGSPRRIVGINRDISDQVAYDQLLQESNAVLEQRVAERTADLQSALGNLQRANQLKDEFMAMISHELRTPLTGVLSLSELLADGVGGPLNVRQVTYVKGITESGERLLAVINGILSYTHLLGGKVKLDPEVCDLADLLDNCAAAQQHKAAEKHQSIGVSVAPPGLAITVDPTAVAEVLKRLLENAFKFTPAGGHVGLEAHPSTTPGAVDLVVWDTGIGIPADQVDRVFHAFTQADARLSRSHEGLGLGLAYVDEMVRLMGGTLHLESEPGAGSCFTITLLAGPA